MKVKLSTLVPRIVDKWSYELLHRAKMGETQAMMTVAQIQFSRHGWGRIRPDAVQARRWLEYGASRGDPTMHSSLQNLRSAIQARQADLNIARQHGLIDINKRGFDGKQLQAPSEQVKLPPLNFNRVITNNPANVVERTSEEEALEILYKKEFKPIEETIRLHKQKLLAEHQSAEMPAIGNNQPINFKHIEEERLNAQNKNAIEYISDLRQSLQARVKAGTMDVAEAQRYLKQLDKGVDKMDKKQKPAKGFESYHPAPDTPQRR